MALEQEFGDLRKLGLITTNKTVDEINLHSL